jgi:hypothetical protein
MDSWVGIGLVILFVVFQILRAAFRGAKATSGGMARLNAAAERILKERSAPASNLLPRSMPGKQAAQHTTTKPRQHATSVRITTTPAVMRRDGLFASGREPVIQRRR